MANIGDLRVWHIPQIPGPSFHVPVSSPDEAVKFINTLAEYDQWQLDNNIKPDYSSASGLEVYEGPDPDEPGDTGWHEWYDADGFDIDEYAAEKEGESD